MAKEPEGGKPPEGGEPPAPKAEGKFSQEDLDKIAGQARSDGRTAAEKELLKALGVEDLDAAKKILADQRAAEELGKSELQKAQDEAAKLRVEADEAKREAREHLALARIEGSLRDAGINPGRIPQALRLVDLSQVTVEGSEVKGVTEVVTALKTEVPELFGKPVVQAPAVGGEGSPPKTDLSKAPFADLKAAAGKYGLHL